MTAESTNSPERHSNRLKEIPANQKGVLERNRNQNALEKDNKEVRIMTPGKKCIPVPASVDARSCSGNWVQRSICMGEVCGSYVYMDAYDVCTP